MLLLVAIATVVALVPKTSYAHRYFDSWSARWTTPDPYMMVYPAWSAYNYGLCNPLRNIDPSGDTTYAYNQNHDLVPIDNSPDVISWGRQDPNYISANFTWVTAFSWFMIDPWMGKFHNMHTEVVPTAIGARWYEPRPTVNIGIVNIPGGPGAEEEAADIAEDIWRAITPTRPLSAMGHAARHLEDFQEIIPDLTSEDLAKIIDAVRQNPSSTEALSNGQTAFQARVEAGGKVVNVRVIESSSGIPRTAYPVNK